MNWGDNLVTNGTLESFQGGNPNVPTGWTNYQSDAGELADETTIVHEGSHSLHINVNAAAEGCYSNNYTIVAGIFKVSFWFYPITGTVRVWVAEGDGTILYNYDLSNWPGYAANTWLHFVDVRPNTVAGNSGSIWFYSQGGAANYYIDDVSVRRMGVEARNVEVRNYYYEGIS